MVEQANKSAAPGALPALLEEDAAPRVAAIEVPPEVPLDEVGRVDAEVQCRRCGYVLMRQFPGADCPECGHAVIDSLRGDRLKFANPVWLDTLAAGTGWIITGMILFVLLSAGSFVFSDAFEAWHRGTVFFSYASPTLCIMLGCWYLTSREPVASDGSQQLRLTARWTSVASGVIGICYLCLAIFLSERLTAPGMSGLYLLAIIMNSLDTVAVILWICSLLKRLPSAPLIMQFQINMLGLVVYSLGQGGYLLPWVWAGWIVELSHLSGLVSAIWIFILFLELYKRLRSAAEPT